MKRVSRTIEVLAAATAVSLSLCACGGRSNGSDPNVEAPNAPASSSPPELPTHYFVFLDETASDAAEFDNAKNKAAELLGKTDNGRTLKSPGIVEMGDSVTVIGIDDRSYGTDDVRMSLTFNSFKRYEFQSLCVKGIKDIQSLSIRPTSSGYGKPPRGTPKGTDTEGSLDYATQLMHEGEHIRLVLLSDLQDFPAKPTSNGKHFFPPGTEAVCLFVQPPKDETGGPATDKTVSRWSRYLTSMGIAVTRNSFTLACVSNSVDVHTLFHTP